MIIPDTGIIKKQSPCSYGTSLQWWEIGNKQMGDRAVSGKKRHRAVYRG
jgi:hypothetical protein